MMTTRSGDLTRSTHRNKRACNAGETTKTLVSGDSTKKLFRTSARKKQFHPHVKSPKAAKSGERPTGGMSNFHPDEPFGDVYGEGVWRGLSKTVSSNIHRIVVALASFDGETKNFACTGFFIEWNQSTTILTSACLVRRSGHESKIDENLRIEVFLPNKQRKVGTLQHCNAHYNVALVSVKDYHAPRPASIQLQYFKCSKVAAVGRSFESGILMAASGVLVDWTGTHDCKFLVHSSCKINKAGIGGPLIDFDDGRVLGMNFYDKKIGTPFLLWNEISNILANFLEKEKRVSQTDSTVSEARNGSDPSGVSYWKMTGDRSVRPNRWLVDGPYRRRRSNLGEDESEDEDDSEDESEDEGECEQSLRYTYRNGKRWLYC